jgi:hypothetical protein
METKKKGGYRPGSGRPKRSDGIILKPFTLKVRKELLEPAHEKYKRKLAGMIQVEIEKYLSKL